MRASASLLRERRVVAQPPAAGGRLVGGHGGDLFGHHLQRRGGCAAATFELQQILRDGPAVIDLAEHIGLRHPDLIEEHLVLDLLARRHHQRADLNSRRRHVDQHERDALLLLRRPCCAHQAEHPVRFAGVRGPYLAAGTYQVVAVVDRRHRQRRQVRARLGFGVALTEEHLAGQDPRQVELLLRVRAEFDDRVGDHPDAHRRQRRSPGQRRLAAEDVVLGQAPVAAAVLDRPGRRRPAAFVQDPLPLHAGLVIGIHACHEAPRLPKLGRQFFLQEGAHVIAER